MMTRGHPHTSVLDGTPTGRDTEPATSPIPLRADPPTDPLPTIDVRAGIAADPALDDDRHTRQVAVLAAFLALIVLVALLMGVGVI